MGRALVRRQSHPMLPSACSRYERLSHAGAGEHCASNPGRFLGNRSKTRQHRSSRVNAGRFGQSRSVLCMRDGRARIAAHAPPLWDVASAPFLIIVNASFSKFPNALIQNRYFGSGVGTTIACGRGWRYDAQSTVAGSTHFDSAEYNRVASGIAVPPAVRCHMFVEFKKE